MISPNAKEEFIKKIRRRRNAFWIWLPLGLLVMGVIQLIFNLIFEHHPGRVFNNLLNFGWAVVAFTLVVRISKIRCPRCGSSALRANPLISMKHVRCRCCDYPYENTQ